MKEDHITPAALNLCLYKPEAAPLQKRARRYKLSPKEGPEDTNPAPPQLHILQIEIQKKSRYFFSGSKKLSLEILQPEPKY